MLKNGGTTQLDIKSTPRAFRIQTETASGI